MNSIPPGPLPELLSQLPSISPQAVLITVFITVLGSKLGHEKMCHQSDELYKSDWHFKRIQGIQDFCLCLLSLIVILTALDSDAILVELNSSSSG